MRPPRPPPCLRGRARLGGVRAGTAFPSADDFVGDIKRGGVGAMELCAMHMKVPGCLTHPALMNVPKRRAGACPGLAASMAQSTLW